MAKSEPKTRSSTTAASSTPSPVPPNDGRSACSAIWPDTATSRCGPVGRLGGVHEVLGQGGRDVLGLHVEGDVDEGGLPSALIWWAPARRVGLVDHGDVGELLRPWRSWCRSGP